eukprot:c26688_g1_i1 orf=770-1888(+)
MKPPDELRETECTIDTAYEVLSRVDGITLATAACVNKDFHSIAEHDKLWEKACNVQWPSTRGADVKSIVSSVGGFRNFYAECYPLVLSKQIAFSDAVDRMLNEEWSDDYEDTIEELSGLSTHDFVSIIDVVFQGRSSYTKVVEGIPGASNSHGWFYNSPFRIDLLNFADGEDEHAGQPSVTIDGHLPCVTSVEKERKDGRLWKALWEDVRLSWILVHKKTKQMVNLSSWRPLNGQRHWPSDLDFLVRFGSILPDHDSLTGKVVQCNIILKCRLSSALLTEQGNPYLEMTELSLQLEDMEGSHLYGSRSLLVLKEALECNKSKNHMEVLHSYQQYLKIQSEMKEEKFRSESRLNTVCIISWIAAFISFFYFLF